jgi:pyruvate kinase
MLSAESAVGKYPIEAIRMMDRIAIEAENDPSYGVIVHATRTPPQATAADAIAAAAHTVADTLKLAGIICYTATGSTALRVARERPGLPVIGLSPVLATARKLAMVWGVHCVLTGDPENQAAMVRKACRIAFDEGFARAGEGVIIVAGVPLGSPGTTNMVRIAYLDEARQPGGGGGLARRLGRPSCAAAADRRDVLLVLAVLEHRRAGHQARWPPQPRRPPHCRA